MIEEVKKILPELRGDLENFAKDTVEYFQKTGIVYPPNLSSTAGRIAKRLEQICQLIEPKPDEGRLLTDERMKALCVKWLAWDEPVGQEDLKRVKHLFEAQRDLTRRECQDKQERIIAWIDEEGKKKPDYYSHIHLDKF